MPPSFKVLVVGTTSDYIDWIRNSSPGRALFITDPAERRKAEEPGPSRAEEILCDLCNFTEVHQALRQHLRRESIRLEGIACYDCESMELAAVLAGQLELPYPSVEAVNNCRNKYLSKTIWAEHKLCTPRTRKLRTAAEAVDFFQELGGPCVLKPVDGSGSELIFRCDSGQAAKDNFEKIRNGLQARRAHRLYKSFFAGDPVILGEELVHGQEFSCDFVLENGRAEVIRLTRKILSSRGPFGTAMGYLLPGSLPDEIDERQFLQLLCQSALVLGLSRAVCMLDFMIHQGRIILLELAPRPGGDCLPYLLRRCRNLDILNRYLDFCCQQPFAVNPPFDSQPCIGLRLHAQRSGILKKIDARRLQHDPRVREIFLSRKPGHPIKTPPDDYDSWLLGHIIFEPDLDLELEAQCRSLAEKLIIEVE